MKIVLLYDGKVILLYWVQLLGLSILPRLDKSNSQLWNFKYSRGARWLSGRALDSGARGRGFETYVHRVISLNKTLYSPKVLVIPRKQWLRPDMTEKLLTGTLNLNTNKYRCLKMSLVVKTAKSVQSDKNHHCDTIENIP